MTYWIEILPPIVEGFKISLFVYAVTMVFALPIGMGFGLLADIVKPSRKFIAIFTWIIRGTPLLLQLYITMYAIPLIIPMRMNRLFAGSITFIINYAAYFTEIFRSGLAIIPLGQWQAGEVLGLKKSEIIWHIILPQMFRNTLLPLINEAITLVKDTSLAHVIGVMEIYVVATNQMARSRGMIYLVVAGIFYLIMNAIVSKVFSVIEKRMNYYR